MGIIQKNRLGTLRIESMPLDTLNMGALGTIT